MGILVKGGEHLESLGHLRALGLDKTGTLTQGVFRLNRFVMVSDPDHGGLPLGAERAGAPVVESLSWRGSVVEVLRMVLSVEQPSNHPMAVAVHKYGEHVGLVNHVPPADHWRAVEGEGVQGIVDGRFVAVGNAKMMARLSAEGAEGAPPLAAEGVRQGGGEDDSGYRHKGEFNLWKDVKRERAMVASWEENAATAAWVWVNEMTTDAGDEASGGAPKGGVVACFGAVDLPRVEAASTVRRLRQMGVESVMLTGDSSAVASAIQRQVGVASHTAACFHPPLNRRALYHSAKAPCIIQREPDAPPPTTIAFLRSSRDIARIVLRLTSRGIILVMAKCMLIVIFTVTVVTVVIAKQ